jgi:hypothetical protein
MTLFSIPAYLRNVVEHAQFPELVLSDLWQVTRRVLALTISPGKGLLFYSPALVLALIGARGFFRTQRNLALGIFGFAIMYTLGVSLYPVWWGGLNWGPRYLIPLLPVVMLAAAPGIAAILRWPPRRAKATLLFLALIALFPQLAGTLTDIRLFEGELDRALYQVLQDYHRAMEQVAWNPAYNPLLGQWRMLGRADPAPAWIRDHQLILAPIGIGVIGAILGLVIIERMRRHADPPLWTLWIIGGAALALSLLAVVSLRQIADDPRLDFHLKRPIPPTDDRGSKSGGPSRRCLADDLSLLRGLLPELAASPHRLVWDLLRSLSAAGAPADLAGSIAHPLSAHLADAAMEPLA